MTKNLQLVEQYFLYFIHNCIHFLFLVYVQNKKTLQLENVGKYHGLILFQAGMTEKQRELLLSFIPSRILGVGTRYTEC